MYALTLLVKRTVCLQNKLQTATYTEFQTRSLRLSEIPFFIFPAKDRLKNPYKDAMVDAFWKNSKKSIFLLLYGRYRIIRKLNPAFVSHQKLKKFLFMLYYDQKFLLRKNNMALYSCLRVTFLCLAGIFFLFTLLFEIWQKKWKRVCFDIFVYLIQMPCGLLSASRFWKFYRIWVILISAEYGCFPNFCCESFHTVWWK